MHGIAPSVNTDLWDPSRRERSASASSSPSSCGDLRFYSTRHTLGNMMKQLLYSSAFVCLFQVVAPLNDTEKLFGNAVWFEGTFGFIMPLTGCPDGYFWRNGTRLQLLSFFGNSVTCLNDKKTPCHFYGFHEWCYPVVESHYCVKKHPESLKHWPSGSYCFNMYLECPYGFVEGSIFWDDHNMGSDENQVFGILPNGQFDSNTLFKYCCRGDGNASIGLEFPISKPFYLYRYKGKCQQINDMSVTEEVVTYDTPETFFSGNSDSATGAHPDCTLHPIMLHFCYYEPAKGYKAPVEPRKCKTSNTSADRGLLECCRHKHLAWMLLGLVLTMTSWF